jgi:hypothetical protein
MTDVRKMNYLDNKIDRIMGQLIESYALEYEDITLPEYQGTVIGASLRGCIFVFSLR